jgi:hypothetical protein
MPKVAKFIHVSPRKPKGLRNYRKSNLCIGQLARNLFTHTSPLLPIKPLPRRLMLAGISIRAAYLAWLVFIEIRTNTFSSVVKVYKNEM